MSSILLLRQIGWWYARLSMIPKWCDVRADISAEVGEHFQCKPFYHGHGLGLKFIVTTRNSSRLLLKVASRSIERRVKRSHGAIYIPFDIRFHMEFQIMSELHAHGLAPKPILLARGYFLREFVKWRTLAELARDKHDEKKLLCMFEIALQGIAKIHALNHIHYDPTPSNIIIPLDGGSIRFIDFEIRRSDLPIYRGHAHAYGRFITKFCEMFFDVQIFMNSAAAFLRENISLEVRKYIVDYLSTYAKENNTRLAVYLRGLDLRAKFLKVENDHVVNA